MKQVFINIVGWMIGVGIVVGMAIINDPYMAITIKLIFFTYLTFCILLFILLKSGSIKRNQ